MNVNTILDNSEQKNKACKICNIEQPVSNYRLFGPGKKYLYPYCKSCANKQHLKSYHSKRVENIIPDLEGEVWKPVVGYEGLYVISNFARVKRLPVAVPHGKSGYIRRKENLMRQSKGQNGYYRVSLNKGGKLEVRTIHTLVWDAFGDKKRDGFKLLVDHIDNNKENNHISNLQCVTPRINNSKDSKRKHSKYVGVSKHSNNPKCWQASITTNGVRKNLGLFYTEEEASNAYQQALAEL